MHGHYQWVVGKGWGRRRLLIAAVIAALVVVPAVLVFAQQRAGASATILSILSGTASVARGTAAFAAATDGDIVNTGDRVQTAERSYAMVTFFDGSTLEIEPATTVQIEEAASVDGAIAIRISQTIGRTWASVQQLTRADSRFEIRTPTLIAAVRGTGFITDVLADGTSTVRTTDGTVLVTAQGQTVTVPTGQTTTAAPNSPPTAPAPVSTPPNRLRFGMHSPAHLVVMDSSGRACGIVLPGPNVVRQIPGCLASDPGTDPQLIDVPDAPAGTYRLFVTSTAPGGALVASASAMDGSGALSFNYTASASGQPGAKFTSSIAVATGPNGALTASGLGPLTVTAEAPVKFVRGPQPPLPSASGPPDAAAFPPLPGLGFTAGTNVTPTPSGSPTAPTSVTASPSPTPEATATSVATSPPPNTTAAPTFAPTAPPTTQPTAPPTVPPTLPPTPTPTPSPQPTPTPPPPTLSGGSASAGGSLPVLGTNWPVGAAITITWPDGTQVASADVQPDGRFATIVRIPQSAVAGTTYKITASGGGLTQTADVTIIVVYSPTLTLLNTAPPRAGTSVAYSGTGWPPSSNYTLLFDGTAIGGGTTSAVGTLLGPTGGNPSFTVPANTAPGAHVVRVTSGNYSANASLTTQ
jgi:hypothetical protein